MNAPAERVARSSAADRERRTSVRAPSVASAAANRESSRSELASGEQNISDCYTGGTSFSIPSLYAGRTAPEMRLDLDDTMHHQDEFEVLFVRAAKDEEEEKAAEVRRGSLPMQNPSLQIDRSPCPRRTRSCKLPSRRARAARAGSISPREVSKSPRRDSATHEASPNRELLYAQESSLRAPSPRTGVSHSAPHSRSSSWKKAKRPRSFKDLQEAHREGGPARARSGSIPMEECISSKLEELKIIQSEDCCVVRNFATSSKGIINRGDSFKRKSNQSICSEPPEAEGADQSKGSSVGSAGGTPYVHNVLVLGSNGVGKTALLQQFMTSEYMGAVETNFDYECEKTVSVLLDGEETMMEYFENAVDQDWKRFKDVEAFAIVYSITDEPSFRYAINILHEIRHEEKRHTAIILVANKSDLVRTRQVSEEDAKDLCREYDSKYIELSAALNHKVDDLLVGITTQIRLNPKRGDRRRKKTDECGKDANCVKSAKGFLHKIFKSQTLVSKSCDNLLAL